MRMATNGSDSNKKHSENQHHHQNRRISGHRHSSDPTQGGAVASEVERLAAAALAAEQHGVVGPLGPHIDADLFSILNSMHLTNQQMSAIGAPNQTGSGGGVGGHVPGGGSTGAPQNVINMPLPVIVASRKRKILENSINGSGPGKLNGMRPPAHRRTSDDDDEAPLQTPQCSQSGRNFFLTFHDFTV